MSVQMMGAVITCGPQDRTQFCVMLALANVADVFGFCFPSIETIAREARCDERTTRRQIVELEHRGWIHVARKVHNGKSNVYHLNAERLGVKVPSDAKRHPLSTRLLKLYPDAVTPIFAPEKSEDTTLFSEDNPQGVQRTLEPTQRTFEGGSEDIACPPIRYNRHSLNRQEPSDLEPTPPTPSAEGVNQPEPELPPEAGAVETYGGAPWDDAWNRLRIQGVATNLRAILPTAVERNFAEIVPGQNDFDACFREWWLLEIRHARAAGIITFVTEASLPERTQAGVRKYQVRLARLVRLYFPIVRDCDVRFEVKPRRVDRESAA